jgi:hypothetical protein
MSLTALPTEVQIVIASHLAATPEQPMDDLNSLWVTCSSKYRICDNPTVGRCLALDRFRRGRTWDDPIDYKALHASLTQVGNLEACFLTGIQTIFMEKHSYRPCLDDPARAADGGHNLAAYLVAYCFIGTMVMPAMMTL